MKAKRVLSLVLALAIAFSMFTVLTLIALPAVAAEGTVNTKNAVFIGKTGSDKHIANIAFGLKMTNAGDGYPEFNDSEGGAQADDGRVYFKLTFKAKMLSGSKPIVSFIRRAGPDFYSGTYTEPKWVNNGNGDSAGVYNSYSYDAETGDCEVIFSIEPYILSYAAPWGFIAIGNVESNNAWQSEHDFDNSFIMTEPELYSYVPGDGGIGEYGDNLVGDFSDKNMDMNTGYIHRKNGSEGSLKDYRYAMIYAPADKWFIQSTPDLVKHITVPADFFTDGEAEFVKHEATDKTREYYTSDNYAGLYFQKIGDTYGIIDDISKKVMVIKANMPGEVRTANIAVPLNLNQYFASSEAPYPSGRRVYLKVTFDALRLSGDGKPMLTRLYPEAWGNPYRFRPANNSAYNITEGEANLPQTEYDPETGKFTGWVRMYVGSAAENQPSGANEALLIGNSEIGQATDDNSYRSSFAIYNIHVDLYDVNKSFIRGDIAAGLYAETVHDDYSYIASSNIENTDKQNRNIARAMVNNWSVVGDAYMVDTYDVTDCLLAGHILARHAETQYTREYYRCDECGKNYADPVGKEELSSIGVKQKMIVISPSGGALCNAIIPLDFLDQSEDNDQYYVFRCKMKIDGDEIPAISVMRPTWYSNYSAAYSESNFTKNGETGETLFSRYDPETFTYTAVIKLYFSSCSDYWSFYLRDPNTFAHQAILLGNAKHVGKGSVDAAYESTFAFTDPELYLLSDKDDPTSIVGEDVCPNITEDSLNFGATYKYANLNADNEDTYPNNIMAAPAGKWSIDGYAAYISAQDIPEGYFGEGYHTEHTGGTATCTKCAICTVCGNEYGEIDPDNHTLGEWVTNESKHYHHCSDCDTDIDIAEHNLIWQEVTPATAEAEGLEKQICSVCGYETGETRPIEKHVTHLPGDVNNDGNLNNKDLTRLFQYLSDWDVEVNESALDINGDGNVNNKDLTRLFQYLSDWDVDIF